MRKVAAGTGVRLLRSRLWGCTAVLAAAQIGVLAMLAGEAKGFKWQECPTPPLQVYPSKVGATNAPFIHPGRPLTIMLNEAQVAASGGFATTPSGNLVSVTLRSPFGESIELAPRLVTATSPSVLRFAFPQTQDEIGDVLSGPAEILVLVAGQTVAHINPSDFVALPAASNVTAMVSGDDLAPVVQAALGADGDLWVPIRFQGNPKAMPGCPGNFIMMPAPVHVGGALLIDDTAARFNPLERIRGVVGYLGEMDIDGTNFYGMELAQKIKLVQVRDTLGVSVCQVNDAADLVLRVLGNRSWANAVASPFLSAAAGCKPIRLELAVAPQRAGSFPEQRWGEALLQLGLPPGSHRDSFGNECGPGTTN